MIIDSHCHAWSYWPYTPAVPDPESRGTVEQLLFEMNSNSVDQALVVCAEIDHNPDNNGYVANIVKGDGAKIGNGSAARLHQIADVDSMWKPTYHTPGAAERLKLAAQHWNLRGFTHYLRFEDDGSWLISADGLSFFQAAAERKLIASLHCHPHQQKAIREVARDFPDMPILIHHLGHPHVGDEAGLDEILASASSPNIYIKTSGFYYATQQGRWDYPYADVLPIVRAIYERYGAQRMCWGSDYPVVRSFMTYRQALETFRQHCTFLSPDDMGWVLGRTLAQLLSRTTA